MSETISTWSCWTVRELMPMFGKYQKAAPSDGDEQIYAAPGSETKSKKHCSFASPTCVCRCHILYVYIKLNDTLRCFYFFTILMGSAVISSEA